MIAFYTLFTSLVNAHFLHHMCSYCCELIYLPVCVCTSVVVYVNHGCTCGPYLDNSRVGELPLQFGPGSLNRVVRESIQALVDAAPDPRTVTSLLPQGTGKVIIKCKPLFFLIYTIHYYAIFHSYSFLYYPLSIIQLLILH